MKLETLKKLKGNTITNIKIKSAIDKLVKDYTNDRLFSNYTREDIYDEVINECIIDANSNSNTMLGFNLNPTNIQYLKQLQNSNNIPQNWLVKDEVEDLVEDIKVSLPF